MDTWVFPSFQEFRGDCERLDRNQKSVGENLFQFSVELNTLWI